MSTKIRLTTVLGHFEYEKEFDFTTYSVESSGKQIQIYETISHTLVYGAPIDVTIVELIDENQGEESNNGN